MISLHDPADLLAWSRSHKVDPAEVRRLQTALCRRGLPTAEALARVPDKLAGIVRVHSLTLQSRHDSAVDGATKLLFHTASGSPLESVILRIRSGRTSLCVSSQSGCRARCRFCATGRMPAVVDLGRDEILDQVVQANQLLAQQRRRVRNVVFMGMGEPLDNEAPVGAAVDALIGRFGLSPARVIVSTVGEPAAMVRFAKRFPEVGMALSLHSARQATRERLMPRARNHSLAELRAALQTMARPAMIEYLLLAGVNDTDEELFAASEFLAGLAVHINLIPYNAIDAEFAASTRSQRAKEVFTAAGFRVTVRHSLGADIGSACGQLK